jgi:hypothetical protein
MTVFYWHFNAQMNNKVAGIETWRLLPKKNYAG